MNFFNKRKKNDTLFIYLIINNNFNYVNDNYYLININAYNFLIFFNLMKFIIFNNYIYIINEIL